LALAAGLFACWLGPADPAAAQQSTGNVGTHLPASYQPLHKGGVGLSTGHYIRQNEDLIVDGVPALILRRTYLSNYHASKQFGIGTLHNGEEYLIGDGEQFQWVALILASGSRINFRRTSPGTTHDGAEYVHTETPTEWYGAKVFWTGATWILEKPDGGRMTFKGCGPLSVCSIIQSRDADGHTIHYRRNLAGTLLKMDDGGNRWISFEYDGGRRITRVYASNGRWVAYSYDERGRLTAAVASDGLEYHYTYTNLDELATIEEPSTSIENAYDGGRCIRQVNKYPDRDPYIFDFSYRVENGHVVQTESKTSSGAIEIFKWNQSGYAISEARGKEGYEPIVFDYDRDSVTGKVKAVTVTCPDFGSGSFRRTANVTSSTQDEVKTDLATQCLVAAIRR
jgi:YD repeat-containing protein